MPVVTPSQLPDPLLSRGQHHFTAAEAAALLRSSDQATRKGLERLAAARQIMSPSRGLYVVIPPEFRSWATVPGSHFIDATMRHLGRRYYVALLSAAELHGAAHQAPQVFQVMVDRALANRDLGRTRLRFFTGRHVLTAPTEQHNAATGTMLVATPGLTAVDLVDHVDAAGGLNNVATVLAELGPLDPAELARLASERDRATARRLGWLLTHIQADVDLAALTAIAAPSHGTPTDLRAGNPRRGTLDHDWNIRVNADVQADV